MKVDQLFLGIGAVLLAASGMLLWLHGQTGRETPVFTATEVTQTCSQAEQLNQTMQLPFQCPDAPLRIEGLAAYEGPFAEDGTDDNVVNTAALVLQNTGQDSIAFAQITVYTQTDCLQFEFTALPPGERILIPEKNRRTHTGQPIRLCRCEKLVLSRMELNEDKLRIASNGMAGILVENITDRTLEHVYLRYKLHLSGEDIYIGGTTYRMEVGKLLPGQTVEVIPERFVWGYSAIVEICIGEE